MERKELIRTVLTNGEYYYKARDAAGAYFTKDAFQAMSFDDEIYQLREEPYNYLKYELEQFTDAFNINTFDDNCHPISLDLSSFKLKKVVCVKSAFLKKLNVSGESGIIKRFGSSFGMLAFFNRKNRKFSVCILALFIALIMSCAEWFISSIPFSVGDQMASLTIIERYISKWFSFEDERKDAYFINVGYDKQVADVMVTATDTGKVAITNRETLLRFLTIAEKAEYKYLFLDIRFEKDIKTEWDNQLFDKIRQMKNISYSCHADDDSSIDNNVFLYDVHGNPKYAYNDYKITLFNTNFTRYQYIQNGRTSIALKMYEDIKGKKMAQNGIFFFNDGVPCKNCPFIPIKGEMRQHVGDGSASDYYDLGPFLLSLPEEFLINDMKDKIVVVGDFLNDVHDTYMGTQPGPFLTYLAYKYLAEGKNKISIPLFIIITLIFFIIVWVKLNRKSTPLLYRILEKIPVLRRCQTSHLLAFFESFLTHGLLLSVGCCLIYMFFGMIYNIFIPSLIFGMIDTINNSRLIK